METLAGLFAGPYGPILIFLLRIVDVSMATVRILLSVRGHNRIVPFIGLVEVLVWLFAAGNAIRHLESGWHVLGYATGFAAGSAVGLWLEEKLALGYGTVRIISRAAGTALADHLRSLGYGVTEFAARGRTGPVQVIYTVLPRRAIARVLDEVERQDPNSFITVEQPREIRWGWMPSSPRHRMLATLPFDWARRTQTREGRDEEK
jgi:uncharacterized protein YebE (UPF0316 family)